MKVKLKNLSKTKKRLKVEVPSDMVAEAFSEAYKRVGKQARIKGFRKGKIPKGVLDQYHKKEVYDESCHILITKTYPQVLKENNLVPVVMPKIEAGPVEEGKDYHYEMTVEVRPTVELKKYLDIPIKKKKAEVHDKEIDAELGKLQERQAQLRPVEENTVLREGLVATIDIEMMENGQPLKGYGAKNHVVELGRGLLLKDLEEGMVGMKKGEQRKIEVILSEEHPDPKLRGRKLQYNIILQALHLKELPQLDDEFAKDLEKESLATVKKEIVEMLSKRKDSAFRNDYAKEVMDYLVHHHSVEVPETFLEEEIKESKKTKEEIEREIKLEFILDAISKKENIKIEPNEVDERFKQLARRFQQPLDAIRRHYLNDKLLPQLITQMTMEKTLDFLIDKAKLKE